MAKCLVVACTCKRWRIGVQGCQLLQRRACGVRRLERWLAAFGATPAARADWAARLARGGIPNEIARKAT